MPKFDCEIKNAKGEILKTQIEAVNLKTLSNMLTERGFYLVKATEIRKGMGFGFGFGGGVTTKELLVFTVQLSTMVGAAIPLAEAVGIMVDQTDNKFFKGVLEDISKTLQSGGTFSSGLRKHPKVFSAIYCNMVEAGEAGGILDQTLTRLAMFAEADSKMRGKIKGAMTMPVIQLLMAALCVVFLLVKIFPNFTKMFKKMKADLPAITAMMIVLSDSLIENWIFWVGGTVAISVATYMFSQTEAGKSTVSRLSLVLPIIGPLSLKIGISRFARTLCSMLSAGVPILNALKITQSVMGNRTLEAVVDQMMTGVQSGQRLTQSLKGSPIFPTMVVKMMEVGENSGNLDKMLLKVADFYDQEVSESLEGLTAALTPILTVVMGVLIGGIALSVFMPLFSIVQKMK